MTLVPEWSNFVQVMVKVKFSNHKVTNPKMKDIKPDLKFEDKREKSEDETFDENEKAKPERRKWVRWILNIITNIFEAFT